MLKVYFNSGQGLGEKDYTRYVAEGTIQIQKSINVPTTCSLTLNGYDNSFSIPPPMSYVRIYSTKYRRSLFTGFLTADPVRTFTGLNRGVPGSNFQMYSYACSLTSDEYLLNIKSVPFIPAFVNQTQGQILATLAETLAPGFYDTSFIASGDLVPYFVYDPSQHWSDYAKKFGDASRFRYSAQDRQLRYLPYGDGPLGISYDDTLGDGTFDPNSLSTSALTVPMVNDVTMIGQQEAGNNHEDFFVGDGFTGAFPLLHKVYGLGTSFQGSSVLLSDSWNQGSLNTQNWFGQDPAGQFSYSAGELNIISGFGLPPGMSYIYAQNALELAGGVVIQHGEVVFNDTSSGIIGGIYDGLSSGGVYNDLNLNPALCEAGFLIQPTQTVSVTASGAAGISMQPYRLGSVPAKAFNVISKVNKSYTMYTSITAPTPTRYFQTFRSIAGQVYGGYTENEYVKGTITWTILETDLFTGFQTYYNFSEANVPLPDTAIYGVINNYQLNISLATTEIWTPPPGSLNIQCEVGAGLLAPIYISGNVQYTGAFITPSGGNLPIQVGGYDPNSSAGFGPENQFAFGSGIGNQAAELDSGTQTDTLNFYGNDIPGVGVRIRLQTWESQASVSRVRDTVSIQSQASIVGDDGVRAVSVNNLSPLPRTSEDCTNACQAYLADRTGIFYQGTYNASYIFFNNLGSDIEFYPVCGRFLFLNSPQRNMNNQYMLVSSINVTVTEMADEIITFSISFGPDTFVSKMLAALVPFPTNVLYPLDTVIAPTPQFLSRLGSYYLPDVEQTTVFGQVSGAQIVVNFQDSLPLGAVYELRIVDLNWGEYDSTLVARVAACGTLLTVDRGEYDESWYIRMVSGAMIPPGGVNNSLNIENIATSLRAKVLRVVYPRIPSAPAFLYGDTSFVQMDFAGDIRNVEGLEIRFADDTTVCYQTIVGSRFDLGFPMNALRNQLTPGQVGLNGMGQYLINPFPANSRTMNAHFFSLLWEYGPALEIYLPPPSSPTISESYRWGPALQITVVPASVDINRQDLNETLMQFASSAAFDPAGSLFIQSSTLGNPGFMTVNVPVTGDVYVRSAFVDYVGSGAWSNVLKVPQGNLLDSAYLSAQGSVPPAVTNAVGGSGGLFTYSASPTEIDIYSQQFTILYPNGAVDMVPAASLKCITALDTGSLLTASTPYGFFPSVVGPTTPNPTIEFNGPYLKFSDVSTVESLFGMFSDGSVPLVNSAFVAQTTAPATTGGGGGGGTYGGGSCGTLDRDITLYDGSVKKLGTVCCGDIIKSTLGNLAKIYKKTVRMECIFEFKSASGLVGKSSGSHTLLQLGKWISVEELWWQFYNDVHTEVTTVNSEHDEIISFARLQPELICELELVAIDDEEVCDHTYILDGFFTHNTIIKVGAFV